MKRRPGILARSFCLGLFIPFCLAGGVGNSFGWGTNTAFAASEQRLYQGQTIEAWQERIKSEPLPFLGTPEAVSGMLEIVEDPQADWMHRRQVALTLGRIGPAAKAAVPVLIRLLDAPEADAASTRLWALRGLALFGPVAAEATPNVARIVADTSLPFATRAAAVEALANVGQARPETLPALMKLVNQTGEDSLRQIAVEGIALLKSHAAPAIPDLLRALQTDSVLLQRAIAQTLGEMGAAGEVAVPGLIDLIFSSEHGEVQEAAVDALAKMGPDGTKALLHLLDEEDSSFRELALRGIQSAPVTSEIPTALLNSLQDPEPRLRVAAAAILLKQDQKEDEAIETAVSILSSDDRHARLAAYRLLSESLPSREVARQKVRNLEADPTAPEQARLSARKLLKQIETGH